MLAVLLFCASLMSSSTMTGVRVPFIFSVSMKHNAAAIGGAADGGDHGAEIVLVLLVALVRLEPVLAIDLCRAFRLQVADVDVHLFLVLARAHREVQDRAGETVNVDADGRRLRIASPRTSGRCFRASDTLSESSLREIARQRAKLLAHLAGSS